MKLERPWILHAIQNLMCFNCSDVESVQREIKKKKKSLVSSSTNFKNISKFHTDWTICDKAIRSQSITIKWGCAVNFSVSCLPQYEVTKGVITSETQKRRETSLPPFVGLKPHIETRKRCHPQFWAETVFLSKLQLNTLESILTEHCQCSSTSAASVMRPS